MKNQLNIAFKALVFILVFSACQTLEVPDLQSLNGNPEELIEPCMCGTGGGGGGGSSNPINRFMYFAKGKSSTNINHALSTNSPSSWQAAGGTPSQWQTNNGPAAVHFNNKVFLFHTSNSSDKIIQSHANVTSSGLSWQTTNSNIELGNGAKSNIPLSAAVWNDRIFVASKSLNSDAIYVSRSYQNDGTQWESTAEQAVTDSENDGGYDITGLVDIPGWPPYLVVFNNKLYVFWIKRTTNSIYYKVKETLNGPWSIGVEVTGIQHGERREGSHGVTATAHDGKLYIAYPSKINNSILVRQVLPSAPGIENLTSVSESDTALRPTMASDGDNLVIVYHDDNLSNNNDIHEIYYAYMNQYGTWYTNLEAVGESAMAPYLINFDF